MQLYPIFYRKHGVRRITDLVSPPLSPSMDLELPKDSILHHLNFDEVSIGPEPEDVLIKNYRGRVLVEHMGTLHKPIGSPRENRNKTASIIKREYHRRYRTLRPLHSFERSIRDERTLIVQNYSSLSQTHMYPRSIYSNYYKWNNIFRAMFHNIDEKCKGNDRQHYILSTLPRRLPGIKILRRASLEFQQVPKNLLEIFSRPEYMFLVELWKWMGENRETSTVDEIKQQHYSKVNLVWEESGQFFVLNLGTLMDLAPEVDEEAEDVGSTRLQRRFMKMLIALFECRSQSLSSDELDKINKDQEVEKKKRDDERTVQETTSSQDGDEDAKAEIEQPERRAEPRDDQEEYEEDEEIDLDIERLDKVAEAVEEKQFRESEEEYDIIPPKNPVEVIIKQAEKSASDGNLSAAQLRRYERMVQKYKDIPNPFGEGTLDEYTDIDPTALNIDPSDIKIPKTAGVTDESMLESTLNAFDSKYISKVMKKDIVNAALSVQRAGVAITDFKVEEVNDAANNFMMFTMKLAPIDGEPSTVRFRVPVVNDDGVFVSNNVRYRLRKQRSDKPIRKTSPSTVALTSYYAKVFVDRSQRSVVNYPKWVLNNLIQLAYDNESDVVTNLKHTKTFVNDVELPRIYTILSERVREFTVNNKHRIYVDYNRRVEQFGEELVKATEKNGLVLAGMSGKTPIVVDTSDMFYLVKDSGMEELGRIETLLDLDGSKAPTEIAEFRLFSKNVPVGIALGHTFGLTRLMRILDVRPRRVPIGSRVNLEPHEYAIKFLDETLIFSRADKKAQLILAGLNRYHKDIANYAVDSFDDPEVFENIMEDNNIRVGFIRELQLAMEMFVDPITRDLLEEMGEPLSLDRLLIRACELLLTDWHPDETSLDAMRIRGYERMAGAVFSEVVKGVRRYRSRGVGSQSKIEVNPEAVWQSINQDPSISQIEESNPVHNLKEKELVTYMGAGGRSSRSMVKHTRAYHKSDMGTISESTTDSASVGVNAYLSANPQFANLRGLTNSYEEGKTPHSAMLSTSALLAPGADVDDPKRVKYSPFV